MSGHSQRLNGWKAIGAYFGRDRTTAIRWARERSLPVKRMPGGKVATVYAYTDELDRWLEDNGDTRPALPTAPSDDVGLGRGGRPAGWILALAGLTAVAAEAIVTVEPVLAAPDDSSARRFSQDLAADLARLARAVGAQMSVVDPVVGRRPPRSDYLVRASIDRTGGRYAVEAQLVSAGDGALLWSHSFDAAADDLAGLRPQVAAAMAGVIRCSLEFAGGPRPEIDRETLGLILAVCDRAGEPDHGAAELRLVARRPDLSISWLLLASAEADVADRPHAAALVFRAVALRRIFDHHQAAAPRDLQDGIQIGRLPEEMHGNDRPGARRDRRFDPRGVDIERRGVDIHEYRRGAAVID